MLDYINRRLLQSVLVLILITIFVFITMRILPSDPIIIYLSESQYQSMNPAELERLRHEFGLDKPLPAQYWDWISGVARGNLGQSIFVREDIGTLIRSHMPVSLYLGIISLIISSFLGISFGVICAIKRGKWVDVILTILANMGITAPTFWVGVLLIFLFAFKLGWLPMYGYVSPFENFWLSLKYAIMPCFCLALFPLSVLTRQTRSSMLEVILQDYIRTARSKGLRERDVIMRHALKNAFIPIITILGLQVRTLLGGQVIIEQVFAIPGIGRMMIEGVIHQDFQVVQSGVLVIGLGVLLINLLIDISYGYFDPRIKYQ